MNEDLKPCYDIASDWELLDLGYPNKQISQHKQCKDLYRILDFKEKTITFSDATRVKPEGIIDINRNIGLERKMTLCPLVIKVMAAEKPISMPYIHEEYKVYIEDIGEAFGILYYKDNDEDESIVPIKRFFKLLLPLHEEITWTEFNAIKEEKENVDQAQQGTV